MKACLTLLGIRNEISETGQLSVQLLGITNGLKRLAECFDNLEPNILYPNITVVGHIKTDDCPLRTIYAYRNKLFTVLEEENDLMMAFSITYFLDDLRGKTVNHTTEETFRNRDDERIVSIQNELLKKFTV